MKKQKSHYKQLPMTCNVCGKQLIHKGNGYYLCPECHELYQDHFARISTYLSEHNDASLEELKSQLSVPNELLQKLYDSNLLNLDYFSPNIRHCRKCDREILFGRYCEACRISMGNALRDSFKNESS